MKKRITLFVGIVAVGCLLGLCASESSTSAGLKYSRFSAKFHENGQLKRCRLSGTQEVNGRKCKRWLGFFEDGKVKQFQLADNAKIQVISVPAGSTVFLHPDGKLKTIWFSKDTTIKGVTVRGGAKVSTGFHANGRVSACFLRDAAVFDGVPCESSLMKPVFFHPNGKLKQAALSENATIDGINFKQGAVVRLDEKGTLVKHAQP